MIKNASTITSLVTLDKIVSYPTDNINQVLTCQFSYFKTNSHIYPCQMHKTLLKTKVERKISCKHIIEYNG